MTKAELRARMRRTMRELTPSARQAAAARMISRLQLLPQLLAAEVIAAFWPLADEPDLRPLLARWRDEGKTILLPRWAAASNAYELVDGSRVTARGPHGAGEPGGDAKPASAAQTAAATWLVPGVAFDRSGNRLGRGGGYYDRLLADCSGLRIGITFHHQLCEQVPAEFHDIRMQMIVTDEATISCARQPGRPQVDHYHKESAPWKSSSLDSLLLSPVLQSAFSRRNPLPGIF